MLLAAATLARGTAARAQPPAGAPAECAALAEASTDTVHRVVYLALGNPLPRAGTHLRAWSEVVLQEVAGQFRPPATITIRQLTIAPFYVQAGAGPEKMPGLAGDAVVRVERGGRVALASITSSTGSPEIDEALLRAIAAADSLQMVPPLPENHREPAALLRLRVTTTQPTDRVSLPRFRVSLPITWITSPLVPADRLSARPPEYPRTLRERGIEGMVIAQFVVDREGRMEPNTLRFLRARHVEFVDAVIRVLPGYRFKPARVGRCPVRQLVQLPFEFRLGAPSPPRSAYETETQRARPIRTPPFP